MNVTLIHDYINNIKMFDKNILNFCHITVFTVSVTSKSIVNVVDLSFRNVLIELS